MTRSTRKPTLSLSDKRKLRRSSREAVSAVFIRRRRYFRRFFGEGRWLGTTNRYRDNAASRLRWDTRKVAGRRVDDVRLADYLAASAPSHAMDGWAFLGEAVGAAARGQSGIASHLAYYAELRGAVALMATEGVGVLNRPHCIIEKSGQLHIVEGQGTHLMAWLVLDHWAGLRRSGELLFQTITPGGVPLGEWLSEFGFTNMDVIGSEWLRCWGLDLKQMSQDHNVRNTVSYQPTQLVSGAVLNAPESSKFIRSLWSLFRPYEHSRFEILDRHLLRLSLELAYFARTGLRPAENLPHFKSYVDIALRRLEPSSLSREMWLSFLTRESVSETPILLQYASASAPLESSTGHLQVLARAALLLRLATGACGRMLSEGDIDRSDVGFWWQTIGGNCGLWDSWFEADSFTDLWMDVSPALESLREWENDPGRANSSFAGWHQERAWELLTLRGCERIGLWGLALRDPLL